MSFFNNGKQDGSEALQTAASTAHRLGDSIDSAADRATAKAHSVIDQARDTSHQLREQVTHASDRTAGRIQADPLKSVLIAAAAGAVVALLVGALSEHRSHRDAAARR